MELQAQNHTGEVWLCATVRSVVQVKMVGLFKHFAQARVKAWYRPAYVSAVNSTHAGGKANTD